MATPTGHYSAQEDILNGAFSCWLCKKTFNKELRIMGNNAELLHRQAHYSRFLDFVFSKEEILHAFYQHAQREKAMVDLQGL